MFELSEESNGTARIKVVGVGGGGSNAINNMISSGLTEMDFIAVNTDAQALQASLAPMKLQIGKTGLGAGGNPEFGRKAALEDMEKINDVLAGADMVFVTAGLGGGTGTGGAPVISGVARQKGALTVGVVTKPFLFEGKTRGKVADEGWKELKECVDTLITIPNQRLLNVVDRKTPLRDAFKIADDILKQAVQGISDLITIHGLINLDFADVKTIMACGGLALMGTAIAQGETRAVEAAQKAISSPLLEESSIEGATGVLINITGGPDLALYEINEAISLIQENVHEEAQIFFGAVVNEEMADEVRVTVIATGFGTRKKPAEELPKKPRPSQHRAEREGPYYDHVRMNGPGKKPSVSRPRNGFPSYDESELDIPAIWRKNKDEEETDTPAFLRRKAD